MLVNTVDECAIKIEQKRRTASAFAMAAVGEAASWLIDLSKIICSFIQVMGFSTEHRDPNFPQTSKHSEPI